MAMTSFVYWYGRKYGLSGGQDSKEYAYSVRDPGLIPGLKKGMVKHSSILAWRIP